MTPDKRYAYTFPRRRQGSLYAFVSLYSRYISVQEDENAELCIWVWTNRAEYDIMKE